MTAERAGVCPLEEPPIVNPPKELGRWVNRSASDRSGEDRDSLGNSYHMIRKWLGTVRYMIIEPIPIVYKDLLQHKYF